MQRLRISRAIRLASVAVAALAAALLLAAGAAALLWMPSEDALARRAEVGLGDVLGVPVTIGALHWRLFPQPMLEVRDAATVQDAPVVLQRIAAWPKLAPLLHRQIAFSRVEVEGLRLPQKSLRAFDKRTMPEGGSGWTLSPLPMDRLDFGALDWVGRRGVPLRFDGAVDFDPGWRPRHAELRRSGVQPPAQMALARQAGNDRWKIDATVAGGTWNGEAALEVAGSGGGRKLIGRLLPKNVEVRQMLEAFERHPVVAGRMSGSTDIAAEGASLGALVRSLHTRTRFALAPATVLRFDIGEAIKSAGKSHTGGDTPLQSLSGQLDTQNGADGIVLRYTDLKATSGVFSARGAATLFDRRIDAVFAIDLVNGLVGVPLKVTGEVTHPQVSVPAGAVAGAVVGTAILPGVGTAIGARIGGLLGHMFGSDEDDGSDNPRQARPVPVPPRRQP